MTHAIILGIIQGLTEFLPVSSSGHLLIVPYLLGWAEWGLAFDVALNTGTFLAVLIYFFGVWWALLTKGLLQRQPRELKLIALLLAATVPAALIGYFGEAIIVSLLREPVIAAWMLILFGVILWVADRWAKLNRTIHDLTWKDALLIGVAQSLALVPGVSRSGVTMSAGLGLGLTREEAASFSFLLLAPISFGAAITQAQNVVESPDLGLMLMGTLVSFLVGMLAIHLMLKLLKQYGFKPYIWYRITAGIVFLLLLIR